MKNELFDEESLNVILKPAHWRLITSLLHEEVDFTTNPAHLKWMRTHMDRHPAREILFALKGNGIYGYNGKIYPCQPGTVILFNSYETHDNKYPDTCPYMMHLWLNLFEEDVVGRLLEVKEGKIKTIGKPIALSGAATASLLTATWDELIALPLLPPAFKRAKLLAVLSTLFMRIVESGFGKAEPHAQANFQRQVIETIHRHIAATAGRDVPLSEAARLSGYSKYHFLRLFKQETGQTFHEYVDGCRLKKVTAMQLERRTKTEIAEALGFSHLSTYLRWMKSR